MASARAIKSCLEAGGRGAIALLSEDATMALAKIFGFEVAPITLQSRTSSHCGSSPQAEVTIETGAGDVEATRARATGDQELVVPVARVVGDDDRALVRIEVVTEV